MWGETLIHLVLASFLSGEFLLHIPCLLHFYLGVSLTHAVLASFLSGKFHLHIPCWLHFNLGSFSYTSHASFIIMPGVFLTRPVLSSTECKEFLLHIASSHIFVFLFLFVWVVSLTHPILFSFFFLLFFPFFFSFLFFLFLSADFLLHIPCWLNCYLRNFSYTSRAGFITMCGVSLKHPVLASFLRGEFLLHIQYNFIAKYQYTDRTMNILWCQVHSSRIHSNHKIFNYSNNK